MLSKPTLPVLNRGHPLVRGLMGAWVPYEGSGTLTRDITQRGNHGVFTNVPTWNIGGSGLQGVHSPSVDFSAGATRMLNCGNSPDLNPTAALTFFQLIYPFNLTGTVGEIWTLGRDSSTGGRAYAFGCSTAGGLKFQVNAANEFDAGTGITVNNWHAIAVTGNPATNFIGYVDAVVVASSGWTLPNTTTNALTIGAKLYPGFERGFAGLIALTGIWNRALSVDELRDLGADPYQLFRRAHVIVAALTAPPTTTIQLDWTDNSEHEDDFTIERKTGAGAFGEIDTVAAGVETYDNVNVPIGHTYTYRVKASSAALGDSEYSNEAEVIVA